MRTPEARNAIVAPQWLPNRLLPHALPINPKAGALLNFCHFASVCTFPKHSLGVLAALFSCRKPPFLSSCCRPLLSTSLQKPRWSSPASSLIGRSRRCSKKRRRLFSQAPCHWACVFYKTACNKLEAILAGPGHGWGFRSLDGFRYSP